MKQVQQTSSEQVNTEDQGKSEEQLPEKTVGRLSARLFSTSFASSTNSYTQLFLIKLGLLRKLTTKTPVCTICWTRTFLVN